MVFTLYSLLSQLWMVLTRQCHVKNCKIDKVYTITGHEETTHLWENIPKTQFIRLASFCVNDMAQRSNAPPYVIGPHCMALNAYDVIFVTHSRGDHSIMDHDYNIMFKVNPVNKMFRDQLVLLDVCGKILVTLREKFRSVHKRWNVFKGKSENISDIIFSVRKPNTIQCGTNLHVFLADNKSNQEACDFNITGSWSKKNCAIYDSSRIIAQMRPMQATDRFAVTIFPDVDLAFVITLIAIIDTMKTSNNDDDHGHAGKVIAQVGKVGKVVAKGVVSIAAQVIGVSISDDN